MKVLSFKRVVRIILFSVLLFFGIGSYMSLNRYTIRAGIIDKNENRIVENKYCSIDATDLKEHNRYAYAIKPDMWGNSKSSVYIDLKGNEYYESLLTYVPDTYQTWTYEENNFSENRAAKKDENTNKYGYVDFDGNQITEYLYDEANSFENGHAMVGIKNNNEMLYGIIDINGNEVVPCKYSYILKFSHIDGFYAVLENDKRYIIDINNNKIAEYVDSNILRFIDLNELSKLGELKDNDVEFTNDFIIIKNKDRHYEVFKIDGSRTNEIEYNYVEVHNYNYFNEKGLLVTDLSNNKYYIDKDLNVIFNVKDLEEKGMKIRSIKEGISSFSKDGKTGIMDLKGNVIVEPIYDNIIVKDGKSDFYAVRLDDKYGVIDSNGNMIINPSERYKDFLEGNGEYFVAYEVDKKLDIIWKVILALTIVIECILLKQIFSFKEKEKKEKGVNG